MTLYSIIIPHKDSLSWLQRCIDSIPVRKEIQILVVDDDSSVSEEEWRRFRTRNPHVELQLTHEGKGAGYARNVGMSKAGGKWVLFADADDFFYEGAFDVLDGYAESDHDVLYFLCDSRNGVSMEPEEKRVENIRTGVEQHDIDTLRYRSIVPWGKMIRRSFLVSERLSFDETYVANDVMFSGKLGYAARNPGIVKAPALYCWTVNSTSLYFHPTIRKTILRIRVRKQYNDFLHEHNLDEFQLPPTHASFFFPKHPALFLWAVWTMRFKGDSWRYLKEVFRIIYVKISLHLSKQ